FCSVDAVLELVRSHVPALLGETAGFQVQTDFLSALRECLYLLAPDEQLTFVLDNIEASSNSSRGLFENRVALRAPAGQQKIGEDDHDGRCGNHDQLHLLFHRSPLLRLLRRANYRGAYHFYTSPRSFVAMAPRRQLSPKKSLRGFAGQGDLAGGKTREQSVGRARKSGTLEFLPPPLAPPISAC